MPPRRSYNGGEPQRPYNRWTEDEKQVLLACRRENPDMSNAEFTKAFYPLHSADDIGRRVRWYTKNPPTEQQEAGTRASPNTTTSISTTVTRTTKSPPNSLGKNTVSPFSDGDDDETEDDSNGAIAFSGERTPKKRPRLTTNSTRSERDKPQEPQDSGSGMVQSQTSERQQSLDKTATPMLSPRLRRPHIVPFSDHASQHHAPETNGFSTNATSPPPPPPAVSPSPAPPPPTPPPSLPSGRSEEEQTPNPDGELQIVIIQNASEQQPQHSQVKLEAKNDQSHETALLSGPDIMKAYIQSGAKQNQYFQMVFSRKEECEKENARLKNEVATLQKQCETLEKKCESVQRDKDREISQLQEEVNSGRTERENLTNENMDMRNTINKARMALEVS